jgi:hypothetical protein
MSVTLPRYRDIEFAHHREEPLHCRMLASIKARYQAKLRPCEKLRNKTKYGIASCITRNDTTRRCCWMTDRIGDAQLLRISSFSLD